ncbi:hypothetical protein Hesp01_36310 [Herbidospora sp. NBRC 101105]|nr:hypothetical protein Hesp01_36310 [Herbidospora sp. NBRC 101105]
MIRMFRDCPPWISSGLSVTRTSCRGGMLAVTVGTGGVTVMDASGTMPASAEQPATPSSSTPANAAFDNAFIGPPLPPPTITQKI